VPKRRIVGESFNVMSTRAEIDADARGPLGRALDSDKMQSADRDGYIDEAPQTKLAFTWAVRYIDDAADDGIGGREPHAAMGL
jgi:hypothetical protein